MLLETYLPMHLYLKLEDETRIGATFDERQIGDGRLSSVQYIKFNTKGKVPAAIGSDHPLFSLCFHELHFADLRKLHSPEFLSG